MSEWAVENIALREAQSMAGKNYLKRSLLEKWQKKIPTDTTKKMEDV